MVGNGRRGEGDFIPWIKMYRYIQFKLLVLLWSVNQIQSLLAIVAVSSFNLGPFYSLLDHSLGF